MTRPEPWLIALCASAVAALGASACSSSELAADATDATDAPDNTDATDATDITDGADNTDATDITDITDATDTLDAQDSLPPPCTPSTCFACEAYGCDPIVDLAPGRDAACALLASGDLLCWGEAATGIFGDGVLAGRRAPTRLTPTTPLTELTLSANWACGRATTSTCWGQNYYSHIAATHGPILEPVPIFLDLQGNFIALTVGTLGTVCAVTPSSVLCSGLQLTGHEDPESGPTSAIPLPVDGLPPPIELGLGDYFGCGLSANTTVHCFGNNTRGQLGRATPSGSATALEVALPFPVTHLAVGKTHACAVAGTPPTLTCWGESTTTAPSPNPFAVANLDLPVHHLAAGDRSTCAVHGLNRRLTCWGHHAPHLASQPTGVRHMALRFGTLLYETAAGLFELRVDPAFPTAPTAPSPVDYRSARPATCRADDTWLAPGDPHPTLDCLLCSLTGAFSACPFGCSPPASESAAESASRDPAAETALCHTPTSLTAADASTCLVTSAGTLVCWGLGSPFGHPATIHPPTQLDGAWSSYRSADTYGCGVTAEGFRCLGTPPFPSDSPDRPRTFDVTSYHLCLVLDDDQTIRCYDADGPLDFPAPTNLPHPLLALSELGACLGARGASSHEVWCWPFGATPTRLPTGYFTSLLALEAGSTHHFNSSQSGLYSWTLPSHTPTQLATPRTQVAALAVGDAFACALTVDHRVLCFGDNTHGQLGPNAGPLSTIALVDLGLTGVTAITAGRRHACAATSTEVLCWGDNTHGQLGSGAPGSDCSPRPRPVVLPAGPP